MINLREYLSKGNLWGEIKLLKPFIFIDDNGEFLNNLQKIEYGQSVVFNQFENLELNEVANIIVRLYSDKWETLLSTEFNKLSLLSNSVKLSEYEKDISENDATNSNTINKVSAYNEVDLIDDSGSSTNSTGSKTTNNGGSENVSYLSYENLFNNLNNFQKSNIINIVLLDVKKYLTLDIH